MGVARYMARVTQFSVGRRWRCVRADRISFDFVIIALMDKRKVYCRIEPLPGQEKIFGERRVADFTTSSPYTKAHLKKYAALVPLSLDDIVAAAQ